MQIIDYVDFYLASVLNIMFYAIVIRKVFQLKMIRNKKVKILSILLSSIFVSIINIYNKDVFKLLITIPFVTFGMKYIFNIKLEKAFLYVMGATFYLFIGEIIVGILFSILPVDYLYTFNNVLGRTIGCVAVVICTTPFIYMKVINKIFKSIFDNPKISEGKVLIGSILFLMLISAMTYKNTKGVTDVIETMMNGIIFVVILCITYSLYQESQKSEEISDNYNVLLTYLEKYEIELVEKSKIIHDHDNQIIVINGYIGDEEKLKEYVGTIMDEKKKVKVNPMLKNVDKLPKGLKSLIYYKLSHISEEVKTMMEVEGDLERFNEMPAKKSRDVLKIIGVLIDNAIEAVEKEKEKYIDISFELEEDEFIMEMYNTCSSEIDENKIMEEGYSTKGKGRGYGLSLVKDIIKKEEDYSLDIDIINGQFRTILTVKI